MSRSIRMLWELFASSPSAWRTSNPAQLGLRREQPKTRRPRPTVKLSLEEIEPRIVMSASPLMDQWVQVMSVVQQEYVSTWNAIAQEVRYIQQALGLLPGNTADTQSPRPFISDAPGFGGYLWDPVNGTNASDGHNWDYAGISQKNAANPKKPGDTPDAVLFDPQSTQAPGLRAYPDNPIRL